MIKVEICYFFNKLLDYGVETWLVRASNSLLLSVHDRDVFNINTRYC